MKRRKGTDVNCWRSARISWCAGTPPAGARSAPGAAPGPSADPRNARGAPQVSARGDLSSSILGAEQNGGALPARCGARAACGRAPVWDAAARGTDGGEDEAEDQQRHAPPGGSSSRRGQEGEEEEGEEVEGASGKGSERMTACTIAVRELGCSRAARSSGIAQGCEPAAGERKETGLGRTSLQTGGRGVKMAARKSQARAR
ncbi:unnamed protein product [Prorocentrum cordatum]|uniref:Uncharacterized protein n=1 Tax=Prorocentrum cordatum TaxID=2364126 RepID=A0ABN9SQW9_9DINO|nr:unnamed protein product [Polarella glacialis]